VISIGGRIGSIERDPDAALPAALVFDLLALRP
jgi:hypothetical protein